MPGGLYPPDGAVNVRPNAMQRPRKATGLDRLDLGTVGKDYCFMFKVARSRTLTVLVRGQWATNMNGFRHVQGF